MQGGMNQKDESLSSFIAVAEHNQLGSWQQPCEVVPHGVFDGKDVRLLSDPDLREGRIRAPDIDRGAG